MNRRPRPLVAALLAVALLTGALGCASNQPGVATTATPLQQTVSAREAYVGTLSALNSAHRLGYLSDEDKTASEPYRAAAAKGLNAMEAAALAGNADGYAAALAGFNAAMTDLARWRIQADRTAAAVQRIKATPQPAPAAPAGPKR